MTKFTPRPDQQRMLDAMATHLKGQLIAPTGGGKTFTMITDCRRFLKPGNVVVQVAPQLMLSRQLFDEFDKHLGDMDFMLRQVSSEGVPFRRTKRILTGIRQLDSTTSPAEISRTVMIAQKANKPLILFVTYASLKRIAEADIPIKAIYFDEAHNCVSSDAFDAVSQLSKTAQHAYFFTATPKHSVQPNGQKDGPGMQNVSVYGDVIATVKFQELLDAGAIVKPRIHLQRTELSSDEIFAGTAHMKAIVESVTWHEQEYPNTSHKILYCLNGTQSIRELTESNFIEWANTKGYTVLTIDSKNDGSVNGKGPLPKSKFIKKLNELGEDPTQKLIVLHVKMLGEGIDVKSFTGLVFLRRTVDPIFTVQSIGRVLRACKAINKKVGLVTIVEFGNDIKSVQGSVTTVVHALLETGLPPEVLFEEIEGRGKEDEVVEPLESEEKVRIRDAVMEWQHSWTMDEALNHCDSSYDFNFVSAS